MIRQQAFHHSSRVDSCSFVVLLLLRARDGLIIPHQQLGVFLQDLVGELFGHGDDNGIVTLPPGFLESGADSLQAVQAALTIGASLDLVQKGGPAEFWTLRHTKLH